jgi:DNA-binding IclR family transcriptional regulator
MAQITITTTQDEQALVLQALKGLNGEVVAVSAIARKTGLLQSRVRYAIQDLVDAGKVKKVPTRAFNKHYVRYSYEVL